MLMSGLALFVGASLMCGLANTPMMVIVGRAVAGAALALVMAPSANDEPVANEGLRESRDLITT
jgi:predicted MFS family arabinose efflux permease